MHAGDLEGDPFILATFLARYMKDLEEGSVHAAADYRARYPGHEDLIELELARLNGASRAEGDETVAGLGSGAGRRLGPYRIERELGRGGQGVVWLATDVRLGRKVALKLLTGLSLRTDGALTRFLREAQVASRLDHPGICSVYDAGIIYETPFIAMRYVDGETLAQMLAGAREPENGGGGLPSSRAAIMTIVTLFEKIAHALDDAHEAGIVHRDIKPANVVVTSAGEPVILDFGLARAAESDVPSLTRTGDVFGTPAYMAPEQVRGSSSGVDRRTDVWALGVTLFELLTHRQPFEGPTREGLYEAIMLRDPPKSRRLNHAVPRDLEIIVETAIEKDPDRRYQRARDFAEDLRRCRSIEPIAARPPGALARLARLAKRRPAAAALVVSLALLVPALAAAGGYLAAHAGDIARQRDEAEREAFETRLEEAFLDSHVGNPARATAVYSDLLRSRPDSPELRGLAALARLQAGDPQGALGLLDERPGGGEKWVGWNHVRRAALTALGRRDSPEGVDNGSDPPINAEDSFLVSCVYAYRCQAEGEDVADRALACALAAVVRRRGPPRLLYHLAVAVLSVWVGDDVTAHRAGDALIEIWADSPNAWIGQAVSRRSAETLPLLKECVRRWPDSFLAQLDLAVNLAETNPSTALEVIDHARVSYPKNAWLFRLRGDACTGLGDLDRAEVAYSEAVQIASDPGAYVGLVRTLRRRGKLDEARRVCAAARPTPSSLCRSAPARARSRGFAPGPVMRKHLRTG